MAAESGKVQAADGDSIKECSVIPPYCHQGVHPSVAPLFESLSRPDPSRREQTAPT